MPEGDTIHRVANRLRPVLVGRPVVRFEAPRAAGVVPPPDPGTTVTGVEAVGKHLLVHFDGGTTLRTHLRMSGSWHLYRPGVPWRRPAHTARVLLEVPGVVAVCFAAPVVALERRDGAGPAHLGPDLAVAGADLDVCLARMAEVADPADAIAEVLLDQRIACGVGNVYKSEILWACGIDPATPVGAVAADARRALLATAARLLRANVASADPRRTTVPGGLAVYGRARRPCRRCGTPIRVARQGARPRVTYWCPTCQRRADSPS